MKEDPFQLANQYDRLEEARRSGDPSLQKEWQGELQIIELLQSQAEPELMPEAEGFRSELLTKLKPLKRSWWHAGLTIAASLILGFFLFRNPTTQEPVDIMIDDELLVQIGRNQTEQAMLDYLRETERLLVSIRDFEMSCSENQTDLRPEKEMAKSLLIQQKHFAPQMNNPKYFQAKRLFSQLENILVDVNSLDYCTDSLEVDFINRHVNEERILSKLRLIAQEFQIS